MNESTFEPEWLHELRDMAARGGPEQSEYGRLLLLIDNGATDIRAGRVEQSTVSGLWASLGCSFMSDTIQGFGLSKPHGYAGDFEIIDRIHTERVSTNPSFARWDAFFHAQAAPRAVRNRAEVFGSLLTKTCTSSSRPKVLNVGSGPCRDVARWLSDNPAADVEIECVERDAKAIAYARTVLNGEGRSGRVRFVEADILRYRPVDRFELVWSAGLFDYLSDRLFVLLLRRLMSMAGPGGRVVVGNFSTDNPSRNYMEVFGEWYLHHRDEATLLQLAHNAGARTVEVTSEAEGVNLFLEVHVQE